MLQLDPYVHAHEQLIYGVAAVVCVSLHHHRQWLSFTMNTTKLPLSRMVGQNQGKTSVACTMYGYVDAFR